MTYMLRAVSVFFFLALSSGVYAHNKVVVIPMGGESKPKLIFDSVPVQGSVTNRGPGAACGTQFQVQGNDVTINQIGVNTNMVSAGTMKYVIYDHDDGDSQVFMTSNTFPDDGASTSIKLSNKFEYTLKAGKKYCISGTSDVSGDWPLDTVEESIAGLTSKSSNPNLSNFSVPTVAGHVGADCTVLLYSSP